MLILEMVLAAVIGYLLGSINTSIIVGKFYGIDVRKHGSGNAGATNTLRTLGKKAAVITGLGDVLKGVLACIIGLLIFTYIKSGENLGSMLGSDAIGTLGLMIGGICAIIGHNWPVYFGFKGGKGIFTSFAVVLMMDWKIGLILFGLFLIIVVFTKYISLGSIVASGLFPVVSSIPGFKKSYIFIIFALILGGLAIFRHRSNIVRLVNGTESKFGSKKKTGDSI